MQLRRHVIFVDSVGKAHDALVTDWHGNDDQPDSEVSVNLVFVTPDRERRDQYGLQMERETSVVHEEHQSAHGMFWKAA